MQAIKSGSSVEDWENMLRGVGVVSLPANSEEIIDISAGCEETGFLSLR